MSEEKIKDSNKKSTLAVDRWVEFFRAMNDLSVDFNPLDEIVAYILSIPGNYFVLKLVYISK